MSKVTDRLAKLEDALDGFLGPMLFNGKGIISKTFKQMYTNREDIREIKSQIDAIEKSIEGYMDGLKMLRGMIDKRDKVRIFTKLEDGPGWRWFVGDGQADLDTVINLILNKIGVEYDDAARLMEKKDE
jgi:hypothetical protein